MSSSIQAKKQPGRPRNDLLTVKRRAEILEAAFYTFAQDGYQKTDLQIVADKLGIAKGTIYRYFSSKRELFFAVLEHGIAQLQAAVKDRANAAVDPVCKIMEGVRAYFLFFDECPEMVELLVQERAEFKEEEDNLRSRQYESGLAFWLSIFEELQAENKLRNIPAEQAIEILRTLVYGTVFGGYFRRERGGLAKQTDSLLRIFFAGALSSHVNIESYFESSQSGSGPIKTSTVNGSGAVNEI